MEKDYQKLKGKIIEVFGSFRGFGKTMGWSGKTTSFKLNGKVEWKQKDIEKACQLLGIAIEDIPVYFFSISSQK